jgi:hypothetical protein
VLRSTTPSASSPLISRFFDFLLDEATNLLRATFGSEEMALCLCRRRRQWLPLDGCAAHFSTLRNGRSTFVCVDLMFRLNYALRDFKYCTGALYRGIRFHSGWTAKVKVTYGILWQVRFYGY